MHIHIENRTFDEIALGDRAELTRVVQQADIELFAVLSGDINPAHLDEEYANASRFQGVIAHGMWGGALVSTLLGTQLPGPGTIYLQQSLQFKYPVRPGDEVTVSVEVREKRDEFRHVLLDCQAVNQDGKVVISGEALVMAPKQKVSRPVPSVPEVLLLRQPDTAEAEGTPPPPRVEVFRAA